MCGITGIISLTGDKLQHSQIKEMTDLIKHRGPDGSGYLVAQSGRNAKKQFFREKVFTDLEFSENHKLIPPIDTLEVQNYLNQYEWDILLGHRRLSIIDLSISGFQPMSDMSRNVWLVYNGEIYNFKDLKSELVQLGYEFNSHSDTEVLICAYQEWGIEFVYKLNGMFSFALLDKINMQVYLVRDRYGIKPLYYSVTPQNNLVFASEVKAILQSEQFSKSLDLEALVEYFTFQNIFTDKTFHKDVYLLPPGHMIHVDLNKKGVAALTKHQYWDAVFQESEFVKSERDTAIDLHEMFSKSIERQLVSDVEIGCYLSGGMDSGAITSIASRQFNYIKTFTVGFDMNNISGIELSFDERERAEMLSYLNKTEHYEMVLKSGDMERCLHNFSWHLEEPRIGQSYPNYYAAKLASKFVKVVMAGTGGDEIFGGYPWRYYRAMQGSNFNEYIDNYFDFWQRLIPSELLSKVFAPIWNQVSYVDPKGIFSSVFKDKNYEFKRPEDYINHSLYFEFKTFLHGLLVVEDKLSMAHSLESRVPFLDNDLVDFACKLPVKYKLGKLDEVYRINENDHGKKNQKYFSKTNDGKLILRQALGQILPEEYTTAVKQGFSSPDSSWFKGDSMNLVTKLLKDRSNKIYDFFDYKTMQSLVDEHLNGKQNRRLLVWSLINFTYFLENFA